MTLTGQRSTPKSFDSQYLENGDRHEVEQLKLESSNFVCLQAILSVSLRTTDHPERGVNWVTRSVSEFYTHLNFSGMAEDRIVKFCALVGPRSISLVMTNFPQADVFPRSSYM